MASSALLFDLDGTVWNSWPCYAAALASSGAVTRDKAMRALSLGENVVRLARGHGLKDRRFAQSCVEQIFELELYPGAIECLSSCAKARCMGVVTNLPDWLALPLLDATGTRKFFQNVTCAAKKPSPIKLTAAVASMKALGSEGTILIGDSPTDARAASGADIPFAWVPWGYGDICPEGTAYELERFGDIHEL